MDVLVGVVLGAVAAGVTGAWWAWVERRRADRESRRAALAQERAAALDQQCARLEEQLAASEREHADKLRHQQALNEANLRAVEQRERELRARMTELNEAFDRAFKAAAGQALASSNRQFLELAEAKFAPVLQTHEQIRTHLEALKERSEALKDETSRLARALSRPEIRGRYGEIQLRRIAELAGMRAYCDFAEQASQRGPDGRLLRPDMLVYLPNGRVIAVDAKTNLDAYVSATGETDPQRQAELLDHFAKHVADQVQQLSARSYWSAFEGSPDFVVMFMPGDHFLDAALSRRPELIETAAEANVILASPATLIGLLRAVAVGWREHRLAEEARQLLELGTELHERARVALEHAGGLGEAIRRAVEAYNNFIGSVDRRLMPTLRRFEDAGVRSARPLPELPTVTVEPRGLLSAESDAGA